MIVLVCLFWLSSCGYEPVTAPRRFSAAAEPTLVPTSEAVAKPVYTVQQGEVVEKLSFSARVSPRLEVTTFAPSSGTIFALDVSEGDLVTAGDRIARYDFSALEEEIETLRIAIGENEAILSKAAEEAAVELQQAALELQIAQLELELAEENLANNGGDSAQKQIELLRARAELAQGKLDALDQTIDPDGVIAAEINQLELLISNLEARTQVSGLVAPADGVILGLSIRAGSRVEAEQPVAIIGKMGILDDVTVTALLRSEVLETLSEGMMAEMFFVSQPETSVAGQIVRLPYPYNSGGTDLGFDEADPAVRLLPDQRERLNEFSIGELVQVDLVLDQNPEALWLPAEAIREFSGRNFVVVKDGERERRVDVELGLVGNGRTEVIGNLSVGDQVVGP